MARPVDPTGSASLYGLVVFAISLSVRLDAVRVGRDYILFPALAGFMIVAPVLAIGLYQKSRAIEQGERPYARRDAAACGRWPGPRCSSPALLCPADAAVDAGRGADLCAVLRRAAVPGASTMSRSILLDTPTGWAMLARRHPGRRALRRRSPSPSASSRFRCCLTGASTR